MGFASSPDIALAMSQSRYGQRLWDEVQQQPWRVSTWARERVQKSPEDDLAWALLGLAQSLMGHYEYAISAYREAASLCPDNPWYAHNLGHLLDEAVDKPEQALPFLRLAYERLPGERAVVSSYAHALWRTGDLVQAYPLAHELVRGAASEAEHALYASIVAERERLVQRLIAEGQAAPRCRSVRARRVTVVG